MTIGYYLANVYRCGYSSWCYFLFSRVGDPLYYGFGALSLVFLMLLAFPQAFSAWRKFAIWFIPIAAFLFIIWPEPRGGMGVIPSVLGPGPEQAFQWLSAVYIIISALIVAKVSLRK